MVNLEEQLAKHPKGQTFSEPLTKALVPSGVHLVESPNHEHNFSCNLICVQSTGVRCQGMQNQPHLCARQSTGKTTGLATEQGALCLRLRWWQKRNDSPRIGDASFRSARRVKHRTDRDVSTATTLRHSF